MIEYTDYRNHREHCVQQVHVVHVKCRVLGTIGCSSSLRRCRPPSPSLVLPKAVSDAGRATPGRSLLIRNAELYDGLGGPLQSKMDVLVREGKIERIGRELTAEGLPSLDASGLFLYPGLITSHAHLQSVPGSVLRGDDFEAVKVQQALQLRAYLACGFTSVLDPAIGPETAVRLRAHVRGGQPGPDIFILAPFVTPADGYMTSKKMKGAAFADFWPAVAEDTDVVEFINSAKSLEPVGVKVAIEDGVVFPNLPVFAEKTIKAIRDAGQKTGSRLYVHSISNDEHRIALSLKPYALVHVGMWDDTPPMTSWRL